MHFTITFRRCYYCQCVKITRAPIVTLIYGLVYLVGNFHVFCMIGILSIYLYVHVEWERAESLND